jgi:hypothetical protein
MRLVSLPLDNGIPNIVERPDLPNPVTFEHIPLTYSHFEPRIVVSSLSKLYTYVVFVNDVLQNKQPVLYAGYLALFIPYMFHVLFLHFPSAVQGLRFGYLGMLLLLPAG